MATINPHSTGGTAAGRAAVDPHSTPGQSEGPKGGLALGIALIIGGLVVQQSVFGGNIWSFLGSAVVIVPGGLLFGRRFARQIDAARRTRAGGAQPPPLPASLPPPLPPAAARFVASFPAVSFQPPSPPLPAPVRFVGGVIWRGVRIIAAVCFCILLVIGVLAILPLFSSFHSGRDASQPAAPSAANGNANANATGPGAARQEAPPAINDAIARARRESTEAVKEKQAREAEKARAAAAQAEKVRLADQARLAAAIQAAEAKRLAAAKETEAKRAAVQREADYEAWKTRRKATMEESASHLRPDQVATWNRAMAAWNKLTPAQREAAYRKEYQQTLANSKESLWGAWAQSSTQPVATSPVIPPIPGLDTPYATSQPAPSPAAASASSPPPSSAANDDAAGVPMVREQGLLKLPVKINDAIELKFVVDSGASEVQIPEDVFLTLTRAETVMKRDILPEAIYSDATGRQTKRPRFTLRSLRVGNVTLTDVPAMVGEANSPLLLGQSFLSRFKEWKIDNRSGTILLER